MTTRELTQDEKRELIYVGVRLSEIPEDIKKLQVERKQLAAEQNPDKAIARRRIYVASRIEILQREREILINRRSELAS